MPAVGKTNNTGLCNVNENHAKSGEKKLSESIRDVRNIALGIAGLSGAAIAAEAAGIVSLPAVLPTGGLLAGALVAAGATELIAQGVESAEKALCK